MGANESKSKKWEQLTPEEQNFFREPNRLAEFIQNGGQEFINRLIDSMTEECRQTALLTINRVVGTRLLNRKDVPLEIIQDTRAKLGNASCAFKTIGRQKKTE